MKEFFFYLDAWKYCADHNLPTDCIIRKNWKIWEVVCDEFETEN